MSYDEARKTLLHIRTSITAGQGQTALDQVQALERTLLSLEAGANRERELLLRVLKRTSAAKDAAEQRKIDVFMRRKTADENFSEKKLASPRPVHSKAPAMQGGNRLPGFGRATVREKSLDRTARRN